MDGVGAQAWQAPRVESAVARGNRHDLSTRRDYGVDGTGRRAVRRDTRRRYTAAERRRQAPRRHDGTPAQPPAHGSRHAARRGGVRRPPASRNTAAPRALRLPVSAAPIGVIGHRPVCGCGLGCLPGSVRGGLLYRQGNLRCRRLRNGARGTGPRKCVTESRSIRGPVRPRLPRDRHRVLRSRARAVSGVGRASAPLGPRRLAALQMDRGR